MNQQVGGLDARFANGHELRAAHDARVARRARPCHASVDQLPVLDCYLCAQPNDSNSST